MTTARHQSIIEDWMPTITATGGIDRYDDLHVDQIDPAWQGRDRWLEAGTGAFLLAVELRDRLALNLSVAIAFSLRAGTEPLGVDFTNADELQQQLDWSPPSLYLFGRGQEPWRLTGTGIEPPPTDYRLVT